MTSQTCRECHPLPVAKLAYKDWLCYAPKAQKYRVLGLNPKNFFSTTSFYKPGKANFEILCINELEFKVKIYVLDESEGLNRSLY